MNKFDVWNLIYKIENYRSPEYIELLKKEKKEKKRKENYWI